MNHQEISYALAKQVPDMARGFTIHTNYGDITIEPGCMAERIAIHVQRVLQCEQLPEQATTTTGKVTPDDGHDTHGFKPGAGVIGGGYVQHWQVRRVGPDLCINFAGRRWSVLGLFDSSVGVGDLVAVQASAHPGAAPLMQAANEGQPSTWASPPESAHSCPRTAPAAGTPASSGNPPTCCGSGRECSRHAQHAHGTPPWPPAATPQGHTHSHSAGTASAAPAADSIANLVALARHLAREQGSPSIGKSLVSVSLHYSCGGVE